MRKKYHITESAVFLLSCLSVSRGVGCYVGCHFQFMDVPGAGKTITKIDHFLNILFFKSEHFDVCIIKCFKIFTKFRGLVGKYE